MTSGTTSEKKKILITEDDAVIRGNLSEYLEKAGFSVVSACDAETARELATASDFDLILSDIHLKGELTGVDFLHYIKGKKPTKFILMTAYSVLAVQDEAMASGVDGLLAKPFKMENLMKLIAELLGA